MRNMAINIEKISNDVRAALSPVKAADLKTEIDRRFLFEAKRLVSANDLPPYYSVYFLLVKLLGFQNLGQWEKVAWSIPVEFGGEVFVVEHRKFGLCIAGRNLENALHIRDQKNAAARVAEPYLDFLADEAANSSKLNVVNRSAALFERHMYFVNLYRQKISEADARKDEVNRSQIGDHAWLTTFPSRELYEQSNWLGVAAIETFFSWTEHVFVLLGILQAKMKNGKDVRKIANDTWYNKYKMVFDCSSDAEADALLTELTLVRRQIRNFDAHGSFGKARAAFDFHSEVGAVPLIMPHDKTNDEFKFGNGIEFVTSEALDLIERAAAHIWADVRSPAQIYIQESGLPLILSYAVDGTYEDAMKSETRMDAFCEVLSRRFDDAANMDF